jgi:hypothetical protein
MKKLFIITLLILLTSCETEEPIIDDNNDELEETYQYDDVSMFTLTLDEITVIESTIIEPVYGPLTYLGTINGNHLFRGLERFINVTTDDWVGPIDIGGGYYIGRITSSSHRVSYYVVIDNEIHEFTRDNAVDLVSQMGVTPAQLCTIPDLCGGTSITFDTIDVLDIDIINDDVTLLKNGTDYFDYTFLAYVYGYRIYRSSVAREDLVCTQDIMPPVLLEVPSNDDFYPSPGYYIAGGSSGSCSSNIIAVRNNEIFVMSGYNAVLPEELYITAYALCKHDGICQEGDITEAPYNN